MSNDKLLDFTTQLGKLQMVGGGISEWADVNKINEDTALLFAWYYNNQSELILKMLIYSLHTFFFFFKVK